MSFLSINLTSIPNPGVAYLAFDKDFGFRLFTEIEDGSARYLHDISSNPPVTPLVLLSTKAVVDGSLVRDATGLGGFVSLTLSGNIVKIDDTWYTVNTYIDSNSITVDRNSSFTSTVSFAGSLVYTQGANQLSQGQKILFTSTGTLPNQLSVDGVYYVVDPSSSAFGISATPQGTAIAFTGTPVGIVKVYRAHEVYTTTYLPNQLEDTLLGLVGRVGSAYTLEPYYTVNASNLTPVIISAGLPLAGDYEGQVIINSLDNNIYTWNGLAWVTTSSNTAKTVTATTSAQAFSYTSNGDTPNPSSATITATAFNTEGTVYYQFLVDGSSVQNSTTNTYSYIPRATADAMPDVIEVRIREISNVSPILASDQISCFGVQPGTDAITILLSNEAHTLPADSNGTNPLLTGSGTTVRVYKGNSLIPYSATLASDPSFKVSIFNTENVTAGAITGSGNTATVASLSAMTANRGNIVFDVTVRSEGSESIYQKVQSFAKALAGIPGAGGSDSITVQLIATDYSIIYNTAGLTPNPSSITLEAVSQNVSTPFYTFRETSVTGTIVQASSSDPTYVLALPSSVFTPAKTYWLGVAESSGGTILAYDTISVFALRQSLDGQDAYSVIVTNEAHTLPASSTGSVSSYAGSGTVIEAYLGSTELTHITSGNPTVGQFKVTASGTNVTPGTITTVSGAASVANHSSMTADQASVTYTINFENLVTTAKVQSLTVSKQGTAGSLGTGAATVKLHAPAFAIAYTAEGTTPNPSGTLTLTANAQNVADPWFMFTALPTITGFDETSFTDGTGTTDTKAFTIPTTYFGTPYKFRVGVSDGNQSELAFDTINVYGIRPGDDAIVGFLTNESHTVATAFDGTGATYTTAGGTFVIFDGVTNVTTLSVFAITGGTDGGASWTKVQNGLTFTINETTGVYSLSGASWTSDAESFTVTAVRAGVTITKTYSVSKSKAGQPVTQYYVTATSDVIRKNQAGVLSPSPITFSALSVTGNAAPVAYSGRFRVFKNGVLAYISAANESSYAYTPTTPATVIEVKVELYLAGGVVTLLDEETIQVVLDGTDAVTVSVDNDNLSFPGPSAGFSGINFGSATSTIRAYLGSTLLSYAASGANTFSCTQTSSGVTVAIGTGSGTTFVVPVPTGMSSVTALTDITVTIRNAAAVATTQQVRITYSLARAGNDTTVYWVVASADVIKRSEANALTPASILFTAFSAAGTGTPALYSGRFRISRNGIVVYTSAANETSYSYTPATPATLADVRVELFFAGGTTTLLDEELVTVVQDGTSTYNVSLDNDNSSYPADPTGFAGITFGAATSTIRVYRGSNQLSYNTSGASTFSCTQSSTGVTVAPGAVVGGNSFVVPVPTAMSANVGFTDVVVTIRDLAGNPVTQNVRINYSLARRGLQGTNGIIGSQGLVGTVGERGSKRFFATGTSWSDATANAAVTAAGVGNKVIADEVIISGTGFSQTRTWNGSAWILVTQVIDGNLLVHGSVVSDAIAAKSITTAKLAVIGQDKIINPGASFESLGDWYNSNGSGGITFIADSTSPYGSNVARFVGSSLLFPTRQVPIMPNKQYTVRWFARVVGAPVGLMWIRCREVNASGSSISDSPLLQVSPAAVGNYEGFAGTTASWVEYVGKLTTTATTAFAEIHMYVNWGATFTSGETRVAGFRLEERIPGNLIVEGSITANALAVTSLSSVSAIIGTLRTATTGARTEIKDNLIEVYDASNVRRVRLGIWS